MPDQTVTFGLHVWRKRRFLWGRQLLPLGQLEAHLAATVHPLVARGARICVRLVDVPAPFDRARQAPVRMFVSIWTDGRTASTAKAVRPGRESPPARLDWLRPDPPAG